MTDVIAEIAAFNGRIAKVAGPVRSGKTEALVRRAAALLSARVAPPASPASPPPEPPESPLPTPGDRHWIHLQKHRS